MWGGNFFLLRAKIYLVAFPKSNLETETPSLLIYCYIDKDAVDKDVVFLL